MEEGPWGQHPIPRAGAVQVRAASRRAQGATRVATAPPGVPRPNAWQKKRPRAPRFRAPQLEVTSLGTARALALSCCRERRPCGDGCLFRPSVPRRRAVRPLSWALRSGSGRKADGRCLSPGVRWSVMCSYYLSKKLSHFYFKTDIWGTEATGSGLEGGQVPSPLQA